MPKYQPPKFATSILAKFLDERWWSELAGDLEEQFQDTVESKGLKRAQFIYWLEVIRLLRPHLFRRSKQHSRIMMTGNHLKISYRNLKKNKVYAAINILGLSIGIACVMLIAVYVKYETSYDNFFKDSDRIYRAALERVYPGRVKMFGTSSIMLAPTLRENYPQVEAVTRLHRLFFANEVPVAFPNSDNTFLETQYLFGDSLFFKVFSYEFIAGDPNTALNRATDVVLTESTAIKYFGTTDVVGEELIVAPGTRRVSGVIKDNPANSHIHFDLLGSIRSVGALINATEIGSWANPWVYTYLKLRPGVDPKTFELEFPNLVGTYGGANIAQGAGTDWKTKGHAFNYFLQPIESIHLESQLDVEVEPNSDITYVYIISIVALIILTISSINFVNLSIARSTERAKEVGIRKVMGSQRSALISQFLTESIFICLIASILSIGLVFITIPQFNQILGTSLSFSTILEPIILVILLAFIFVIGIISGFYPALVISSLQPSKVLKGSYKHSSKGIWLRNGLIIVQFVISIFMISGSIIVSQQMTYLTNKDLGFNQENVLVVHYTNDLAEDYNAFFNEVSQMSTVQKAGGSTFVPGEFMGSGVFGVDDPNVDDIRGNTITINQEYVETMEFEIVMGRNFDRSFNDSLKVIINEATVRAMGVENPIGMKFLSNNNPNTPTFEFTIIGVVKDYNYYSLHSEIGPLIMFYGVGNFVPSVTVLRVNQSNMEETIKNVQAKWESLTEEPFKYSFLDDNLDRQYEADKASTSVFDIFTLIAIVMSCTGLFGLATYVVNQRLKEMSIRKVLGASLPNIIKVFAKDFMVLICFAFIIGAPIAYFALEAWLENFAYHINIGFFAFLLAGLITITLVFVTIGYQGVKMALINPTKVLRSD
ncbi:ABC transporter permease [Roseivirga sp.]|uniref:ABC transporter permease n=1 Tax=Roseivirga sp. TaxID=1964215 RepID=UPI003B8E304B